MLTCRTDRMIEELISSTYGEQADARTRYLFSHALHSLVRLAKAEQLQDIRRDTARATAQISAANAREETQALLRKVGVHLPAGPGVEDGWR